MVLTFPTGLYAPPPVTGYTTDAVTFDGVSDDINMATWNTAPTDSGMFSASFWILRGNEGNDTIMEHGSQRVRIQAGAGENISITVSDNVGTIIQRGNSVAGTLPISVWTHVGVSADVNSGDTSNLRISIQDVPQAVNYLNLGTGDIELSANDVTIGASNTGTQRTAMDLADFWYFPGVFLDWDLLATRRLFIDASGKPVDLGATGNTPTGSSPPVFCKGDATTFPNNLGTDNPFVVTGALANAPTSPSD